jgi:hypothetical protein
MSNNISPFFQHLTATHLGQVTFLLQSAKDLTHLTVWAQKNSFIPSCLVNNFCDIFLSSLCSTDLVSSLDNGQLLFLIVIDKYFLNIQWFKSFFPNQIIFYIFLFFISEQLFEYCSFDNTIP